MVDVYTASPSRAKILLIVCMWWAAISLMLIKDIQNTHARYIIYAIQLTSVRLTHGCLNYMTNHTQRSLNKLSL